MPTRLSPTRFASTLLSALVMVLAAGSAFAQTTYTWDGGGGDNNWSTGANWVGDSAPVRGNSTFVTFAGSTRTTAVNNQGNFQQLAGMTFASGAGGFRIEGDFIGFVNGSGEQVITQSSATTQEINATFSFSPNQNSRINLNAGDLLISSGDVFIDVTSAAARQVYIDGSDGTRHTVTLSGNVRNSGSGQDGDLVILANKRVLVTGTLLNGSGNDASVFINDGVLQLSGAGAMSGGRPAIGNTSGAANAALWLDTAGTTFARQLELRDGSTGRRTVGGLNTSGTVTFSGEFVGNAGNYDLAAATGGATVFSGVRNYTSLVHVNRPDGATTYGGTVILSGTTNSTQGTGVYGGTLRFSDFNQLSTGYFAFELDAGDSGTLQYTGGSTSVTRQIWANKAGQTRAAIDVAQAGTTLTWSQSGGTFNRNLTKVGAGTLTFSVPITGTGGNVVVEAGALILTGSNSYSGGTVVSGGTLEVSAGGSEGGSPAALGTGTVSIASGAQVKYWLSQSGSNTVANPFSLSGGTLHTTDGYNTYSGRVTLASGSSTISAQYEDTITLSGGLAGSGNVLITQAGGTGSFAAPTYVLSGTGANTGTVRVNGSSGGQVTRLQLANVNALQSATLDLATADTGTVQFTVAGNNTYALGGLQGSRALAFGANSLSVGGNGQSTTYSGNLSGSGLFTKVGSGTVTLSGNNTSSGGVALDAGTLALGSAGALGSSGTISFGGGTLQYSAGNTTDYSGRFSTASGQQVRIDTNGQAVTLGSNLTSVGGTLTKLGSGTLTLTGTNSYDGGTTVSGGRLVATGPFSIQTAVVNDAEIELNSAEAIYGFDKAIGGSGVLIKTGAGGVMFTGTNSCTGGTVVTAGAIYSTPSSLPGAIANGGLVGFATDGADTYAGVMSGTGALDVQGGDITLAGTNSYTGATNVLGGANLWVNGALGNTAVTVHGGAKLGGSGSIGGGVLVGGGGILSPGNSIASLAAGATTFSGTSEVGNGATFEYEYDSEASLAVGGDLLAVSGNLSIGSGALIMFADIAGSPQAVALGTSFALINYSGTWDGGYFTYNAIELADGATFTVGSQQWQIDYNRTDAAGLSNFTADYQPSSSFVAITAVPEPSTCAMALAGLACGGFLIRRRRTRRPRGRSFAIPAALAVVAASFAPAMTHAASITNVGLLDGGEYTEVTGLSGDGSVAVGSGDSSSVGGAFRWTATSGTLQNLGVLPGDLESYATAVSDDGSVVVGRSFVIGSGTSSAFRWTATSGTMENLGALPGSTWSEARAVSSSGSTVVGMSLDSGFNDMAVRWTSGTVQSLGRFSGGTRSWAEGVSDDGSVVVGSSNDAANTYRAYRWTTASGTLQDLGTLPGGSATTQTLAEGVNGDGSVVVGGQGIGNDLRAFRWTLASGTMQDLGLLPGWINARAFAVSADGATVVGEAEDASGSRAFLWTPTLGMQDLNIYLASLGVDLTDWVLQAAYAVSADGTRIGGIGSYQDVSSGFVANITPAPVPEPSTYCMALAGLAGGGWVVRRRRARA